ncbi:MAG: hypothetical protein PHD01_11885 [Geobacteraceae bacterium]|nr:hypothetical protein [Geobacteraceae bacterium]
MGRIGRKLGIMLLAAGTLALSCGSALAGWTFTDLSVLGDIVGDSNAVEINNNGDIVGNAFFTGDDYRHGTLWSDGVAYDLGTLGGTSTASSINDAGVIVGSSYISTSPGGNHAAIFSTSAPPVDIQPAVPYSINTESSVSEINNSGQMAGYAETDLLGQVPILWSDSSTYQILDAGPLNMGYVNSLNNLGQMAGGIAIQKTYDNGYVGYHTEAAFWDADGTLTHLGVFDGWASYTHDINDLGQVLVGVLDETLLNEWSIVWQNGEVVETLAGLGGGRTEAQAINNNGQIVGTAQTADDSWHAVLWQDGEIIDLNDYLSDASMVLVYAADINEKGQIVGYGHRADGTKFAFLLNPDVTPTPIPPTLLLFGSGLAGLGFFRRRFFRA